jgi:hypothetical protein
LRFSTAFAVTFALLCSLLCVITMAAQISFEDLLKNFCGLNNNEFVWLRNAGVISLMTLCDNTVKELADTIEQIRKEKYAHNPAHPAQLSYKVFRVEQERNLKVLLLEVRIRDETGCDIKELRNADVNVQHLKTWKARRMQSAGFKDPPSGSHQTAAGIAKDWVQGFDVLDEWIRLSFMIRPDPGPAFVQQPHASLANEYAQSCPRTVLVGTEEVDADWFNPANEKVWDILFSIFSGHNSYGHIKLFRTKQDGFAAYNALRTHHLGKSSINNLAADIEA